MTGVEAAGFVLAILPLLISSVEHYDNVTTCFARYRQFAPEVNRYQLRLKTQRTIFQNECRLLLSHVIDRGAADLILDNASQNSNVDAALASDFAHQLGRCGEACLATVEQIKQKLEEIGHEGQSLESIVSKCKSEKCSQLGSRGWRKKAQTKLCFALSEKRHEKNLAALEKHNCDFLTLSAQAHRMGKVESQAVQVKSKKRLWDSARYGKIRGASQALYRALEMACTKHTEHTAHLCLDDKLATSNHVRFRLSFTHLTLSSRHGSDRPTWFLVESIIAEEMKNPASEVPHVMADLASTLKRQRTPPAGQVQKKFRKAVRFRSPSPSGPSCQIESLTSQPIPTLPHLCQRRNFCDQIRNCLQQSAHNSPTCLGILGRSDSWEQRVYPTAAGSGTQNSTSLAQIISSLNQTVPHVDFSQYQRLCVGRLLATAVLQFYATPWLTETWRSEDILFFGLDATKTASDTFPTAPCLNVRVQASNSRVAQASHVSHNLIRNQLLFRLGVVLIELAYGAPLPTLQQPCDLEEGQATRYSEFFTARRLGELVSAKMGRPYGKIVRQCLECDFGQGHHDLNDAQLQGAVYNDIVCELQRLEDGLRSLQL